jgi:dolichol-phosphate mannosyltransferase
MLARNGSLTRDDLAAGPVAGSGPLDLSVVVPVHNETGNIERLVGEIREALAPHYQYEIVVVDDGSSDDTLARLRRLQPHVTELRLVAHATCCGQSTALWTGIRRARAATIATLDGDGQNDPRDIPRMVEYLRRQDPDGPRCLIAGHRQRRQDSAWRRLCSRVANGVRAGLFGDGTPDSGCGIKVLDRELFLEFPYFDHMHRFLPALARRHGAVVCSVAVHHRARRAGASHYATWDRLQAGIVDLLGVFWLLRRTRLPEKVESYEHEYKHSVAGDRTLRPIDVLGEVHRAVA